MDTLILTTSFISTARVEARLAAHGRTPVRLEVDRFPAELQLSLSEEALAVRGPEGVRVVAAPEALWYRRVAYRPALPPATDPAVVRGVVAELRAFLQGLVASRGCFVVDPKERLSQAELKPRQLSLAAACGLDVPATICTSSAEAVRAWAAALGRPIVTKALTSFAVEQDGVAKVMHTTALDADAVASLAGLELCPAAFQELLVKEREFRVTVVGDRLFTISVVSAGSSRGAVDWRRDGDALRSRWRPDTLPAAAAAGLGRLMERLGLNYGAADFVQTADGRCVFLEVNPAGEYLWADDVLDGAISAAIGDLLAGQARRR